MAVNTDSGDMFSVNIEAVHDLVGDATNKINAGSGGNPEGAKGDRMEEFSLDMTDEELRDLRDKYEQAWGPMASKIADVQKGNVRSYLGITEEPSSSHEGEPVPDNLQWESAETFLAAALAHDPDPVVTSDGTPEGESLGEKSKIALQYHAQRLAYRKRIALMVRMWSVYHLGVLKAGWSEEEDDIDIDNRKTTEFLFDPNGYVDVMGNFCSWVGERITEDAQSVIDKFPEHAFEITIKVNGKLGTKLTRTEWWTDEYCFTTLGDIILEKHRNQFWRWSPKRKEGNDKETQKAALKEERKWNHFKSPKKPYLFFSLYSLQTQPHDLTGPIHQNIPNQRRINARQQEMDIALRKSVNGTGYSKANFTEETARQAAQALTIPGKGEVLIPTGGPSGEAIVKIPANEIQAGFFKDLENDEEQLRNSWGVSGIASQQPRPDETAKGQMMAASRDNTRIGGGVGDQIEHIAARGFDWMLQLMAVFYDERKNVQFKSAGNVTRATEIARGDFDRPLIVSVVPDSMMPKDDMATANLAQNLAKEGYIGPKTLLRILQFPQAEEAAADGILYKADVKVYLQVNYPELYKKIQQVEAANPAPPKPAQPGGGAPGAQPVPAGP